MPERARADRFGAGVRAGALPPPVAPSTNSAPGVSLFDAARARLVAEAALLATGHKLLYLAAGDRGPAFALAAMVGPGGHVTVADSAPGHLAEGGGRGARQQLANTSFREADAHDLPFPDGAFDRIACMAALERFARPPRVAAECLRVLKPGGRAAFLSARAPVPEGLSPVWGEGRAQGLIGHDGAPEPFAGTPALLGAAGFEDVEETLHVIEGRPTAGAQSQRRGVASASARPPRPSTDRAPGARARRAPPASGPSRRYRDEEGPAVAFDIILATAERPRGRSPVPGQPAKTRSGPMA